MKKILSMLPALTMLMSVFTCIGSVFAAGGEIFVSPAGSDNADGSRENPVATLKKACELAQSGSTVTLLDGTYSVSENAEINKSNITIKAASGASVTLTGAAKLDASKFQKVSDSEILDRIGSKAAKEKLMALDLKALGITDFGSLHMSGFAYGDTPMNPQLIVNGKRQTLARYPDNDYLYVSKVIDPGANLRMKEDNATVENYKGQGIKIQVSDSRLSKWTKADDLWIFGFFMYDWAEANLSAKIDFENENTISTEYPSYYSVTEDRRFYFYNLLEEISVPGEWYLDRTAGVLYIYPEKDFKASDTVEFITYDKPFITIKNAENIKISGIKFEKSLDMGIKIDGSKNVTVSDCTFNEISSTAINSLTSYETKIDRCAFTEVGYRAVCLESGDRETLTPGKSEITNCTVKGFARQRPTNSPAFWVRGVGNKVAHNEIIDGPYIAIWFGGNDHIIEYNEIAEVCKDTADVGAIYAGRDWSSRGNEVRYNYIHDIKIINTTTGMKVQAIYLDDQFSSANVHGNIIKNVPSVALYGGGRYNTFVNNIVIDAKEPFVFDERGIKPGESGEGSEIRNRLKSFPYNTGIWKEKYPELANILNDDPELPKYNTIKGNLAYNVPNYDVVNDVKTYGTFEEDTPVKPEDFVDYKGGDLTLKDDSEIFTKLPDFEKIDFKAIGVEEKTPEKTADSVLEASVALMINKPDTYVFGKKTAIDVPPMIVSDRTLVPVRFIAEAFGADVSWDGDAKKVTVKNGDNTIELYIDKAEITVNGTVSALDAAAGIIDGRTMLPLRAVVEALGKEVFWDARGLIIISDGEIVTADDSAAVSEIVSKF